MEEKLIYRLAGADVRTIAESLLEGARLTPEEAITLYKKASLPLLGVLASEVKRRINGKRVFFNQNFHIEPTNICLYNCRFCSYHRKAGEEGSWEHTPDQIMEIVRSFDEAPVTEVHIVGGVHPDHDIHYWGRIVKMIKEYRPSLHIKAFSAVEVSYMAEKSSITIKEALEILKEYGVQSLPGGGAEIFDEQIRQEISPEKCGSGEWIEVHRTAHKLSISTNATMLYGHIEEYHHRVDHMYRLRNLQDETGGFNAFIPLKYRSTNNKLSYAGEVSVTEDLRNLAVARLFLDNIPHIKAYWPMLGKENTAVALSFGVDDIDGTIEETTRIYSMAGAGDRQAMSTGEMISLIESAGQIPTERDTLYNVIKEY